MEFKRAKVLADVLDLRKLLFLTGAFFLFSCSQPGKENDPERFIPEHVNKYASYFKIFQGEKTSILITYLNPEKNDSVVYVIYKGKKPKWKGDVIFVKALPQKVACMTSVFIGFLNRLDVLPHVKAVDNLDFITNAQLLYRATQGGVKELSKTGQLNLEATLQSGVQVLFTNPGGDRKKDLDKRLLDAGITPVICADYYENHPLGRAEWIKVFSLFFGMEKKGDSLFAATEKKYLALKQGTDTCKYKPTVFSELKTNDTWFVAGGKSSLSQFLSDAGANYLWKDNGKINVTAMNMEQVIQKALNADYWINLHLTNSADEIRKMDARYGEFKAFKAGRLYNNNAQVNKKNGNLYWEDGLCNPDEILSDLIQIFHPNLLPGRNLKYYKQLK